MLYGNCQYLPDLNVAPQVSELVQTYFSRMVTIKYGDHAVADILGEAIEFKF